MATHVLVQLKSHSCVTDRDTACYAVTVSVIVTLLLLMKFIGLIKTFIIK